MMFFLAVYLLLTFYVINIHIFDYPESRLSGLFTEAPTSPGNQGSTETVNHAETVNANKLISDGLKHTLSADSASFSLL